MILDSTTLLAASLHLPFGVTHIDKQDIPRYVSEDIVDRESSSCVSRW